MKGSLKQLSNSRSGPSGIVGKNSLVSEEIKKLQQDVLLLSTKISQNTGGSVVGDLRSTVADARSGTETPVQTKAEVLDEILKKVTELDRAILRKTEPEQQEGARPRRNSNTVDLYSLPTHFHVVDRLIDYHTRSKRPVIVHQHGTAGPQSSTASPQPQSNSDEIVKLKADHSNKLNALAQKLQDAEAQAKESANSHKESQNEISQLKKENMKLKALIEDMKSKPPIEPPVVNNNDEEMATLKSNYANAMKSVRAMEERIECGAGNEQLICNALLQLANSIHEDKSLSNPASFFTQREQVYL